MAVKQTGQPGFIEACFPKDAVAKCGAALVVALNRWHRFEKLMAFGRAAVAVARSAFRNGSSRRRATGLLFKRAWKMPCSSAALSRARSTGGRGLEAGVLQKA